ncbi:MAG: DNA mismatch repair endonuclease MutL [Chloroflexi bacterium]|nr:DNA mismatch repair endonuclease MutL [Chloroflexota bacterium]
MSIRVLPPAVAAKIAAGEVVERPASVVKELVENSLDAGSTRITVELRQGGRDLIRVTDNGCGIPANEMALAFERHATSKLSSEEELGAIATMGFRGEALPSIAAVARVTMATREPGSEAGTLAQLRGGRLVGQRVHACAEGTSVTVEGLFQEVPARRKYLKSPAAEAARIHTLVSHYAMAYPHVQFTLLSDGRPLLLTPGQGSLRDVVAVVHGAETAASLLPVAPHESPDGEVRVEGLISPPGVSRPNRAGIAFFVNRRWVQSPLLMFSLQEAYQGFLMERRHPVAVLFLSVPLHEVDVNVHPAKVEVRFLKEGEVFGALQRAVRRTLVEASPVPEARLEGISPRALAPAPTPTPLRLSLPVEEAQAGEGGGLTAQEERRGEGRVPLLRVVGQVGGVYIVAEGPDGMYLIDQHAAHERVLFERVLKQCQARSPERQGLLEPATVHLPPEQARVALEHRELLEGYGFLIEPFGEAALLLRAVPSVARGANPSEMLSELVVMLARDRAGADREYAIAASIACHGAVRAGMALEQREMVSLVREMEATDSPRTCPHGRPTMLHLSASHLDRQFGRR